MKNGANFALPFCYLSMPSHYRSQLCRIINGTETNSNIWKTHRSSSNKMNLKCLTNVGYFVQAPMWQSKLTFHHPISNHKPHQHVLLDGFLHNSSWYIWYHKEGGNTSGFVAWSDGPVGYIHARITYSAVRNTWHCDGCGCQLQTDVHGYRWW